jgi:hypothetical protein
MPGDSTLAQVFTAVTILTVGVLASLVLLFVYNIFLHPLAKYPGPWYSCATSLPLAVISWRKEEPEWMYGLVKKYGCMYFLDFHIDPVPYTESGVPS